jgi:RNA polymerase sigma-70 factor (ECF subfamily)
MHAGVGRDRLGEQFEPVLAAAQVGAGWAAERLWVAYAGPVAGYLRLQGASDPDDLTSEVFVGVLRNIGSFQGGEPAFRSWLFAIAHRRLLDARRRDARRPPPGPLEEAALPPHPGPEGEVGRRAATEQVEALCRRLPDDQRDVLLLRLVSALTVEEVAQTLGKTAASVKALQRRGLATLRLALETEGATL